MTDQNQVAVQQPRALQSVAALTGLDQQYLISTLKAQCFKGQASDAQVDAFISIAMEMRVNPLLPGMLYAYPTSGGGIVPIMGPSGVYKKLTEHPDVDSWNVEVLPADVSLPPTHAIAKIYRKGTDRPLEYTALLSEWKVGANKNWTDRPRHMLQLRALKHCANQIIHGIPYDEDDRVIMGDPINVTSTGGTTEPQSPAPQPRAEPKPRRGAAAAKATATEVVVEQDSAKHATATTVAEVIAQQAKREHTDGTGITNPEPKNVTPEPEAPKIVEQPKQAPAADKTARAFLKDGEKLIANVEVVSLEAVGAPGGKDDKGKDLPAVPSVRLKVKGDFNGEVQHRGGGKYEGDKIVPAEPYAVGARITLHLLGKISQAKTGPNVGKILHTVEKAEAMAEDFG